MVANEEVGVTNVGDKNYTFHLLISTERLIVIKLLFKLFTLDTRILIKSKSLLIL